MRLHKPPGLFEGQALVQVTGVKPFLPLRSSSTPCFARAIKMLVTSDEGLEASGISTKVNAKDQVPIEV